MIWTLILTTLVSTHIFAKEDQTDRKMHSICQCEVFDSNSQPVVPGQHIAANLLPDPSTDNYFTAQGEWTIEDQGCKTNSDGDFNENCERAIFRAELRATGNCWEIARTHNPEKRDYHNYGKLVPNSCEFIIE